LAEQELHLSTRPSYGEDTRSHETSLVDRWYGYRGFLFRLVLLKGSGAFVGAVYHVYQLRQDFGCSVTV